MSFDFFINHLPCLHVHSGVVVHVHIFPVVACLAVVRMNLLLTLLRLILSIGGLGL
jgi:hypothetical protein